MNSLFNSALKQSSSVRRDLDAFAEAPATSSPALQGQISATLTSLSRTIDDYTEMAKKELIPAKQEKAHERIKRFRAELLDYRQSFDRLKKDGEDAQTTQNRTELLGRRPHHTSTPENPYSHAALSANSPFAPSSKPSSLSFGASPADYTRETHALREQSFMSSTNVQLDEYLERGRAVLGNLGHQREILKGTQKRLYSVANTLGVSGDTIRMVERKAKQDKWIFWGGAIIFFAFCWLVIHYLRRAPPPPQLEDTEASAASLIDVDSPHISSVSSDYSDQPTKTRTQADREEREAREAEDRTREAASHAAEKTSEKTREAKNKASDYSREAQHKTSEYSREAQNKASDYSERASQKASELSKETREGASKASNRAQQLGHEATDKASDIYNHPSENYDQAKRTAAKKSEQAKDSAIHARDDISANRDNPVVVGNAVVITAICAGLGVGVWKKYSAGDLSWKVAGLWAGAVGIFAVGDYYLSMYLFRNKYPKK